MLVRVELRLPRDSSYISVMRNVSTCLLRDMGVPADALGDIQLAISEACANVVRHAEGVYDYRVSLAVGPDGCEVEVVDDGPGFAAPAVPPHPHPESEEGRGLQLMRALLDDLQFDGEQDGTTVRLIKRWSPVEPGPGLPV